MKEKHELNIFHIRSHQKGILETVPAVADVVLPSPNYGNAHEF